MLVFNEGDSALELGITGIDILLACKSSLVIPYSQISNVSAKPEAAAFLFPVGFRVGTHLPGFIKKGSWFRFDSADFFFVTKPELSLEIDLIPNNQVGYRRLVLQVPKGIIIAPFLHQLVYC
jgi:hypothetical protein